ncbi:hypothetical protein DEU56DRAFT_463590 [Suillus clintonianus]|uniref:uncharacterized protein n=1 Tax=Suillus clintonianus TaxID=1904413 RepID=UPI001B864753|nr:uncharacterized protein DEU56DRAFT_463590 [Suillus clintonianus]KAG2130905.1 hypothetical protein DEU56DRAFT_463590 [Suillus clintonianus]
MRFTGLRYDLSYEWFGVSTPFDPACRLVTSPFFSPLSLGAFRLLFAVYSLVTTITVLVFESVRYHDGGSFFSYFTDLSYIGLVAYFWASSIQTITFVLRGQKAYPLQSWPRILQLLHVLLYTTIIIFPIIVTVVFWALLASPSTFSTQYSAWSNVSQHAMNSGFALFEILLTNAGPSPWSHIIPCLLLFACYLGIAYITHATQGFYTYSFLDPSVQHELLAAYIIGMGVGYCILFAIVKGICTLRCRFVSYYGLDSSEQAQSGALDEWEHVDVEQPKESTGSEA